MITTWTFVLVLELGYDWGTTITVPNFQSLASCQAYGERVASVLKYDPHKVNMRECVPSDYGMPNNRGEKK